MSLLDEDEMLRPPRPRTLTVLGILSAAALVFSWLGAYALMGALASADLIAPLGDPDPRPRWMAEAFLGLLAGFILLSGALGWTSRRQLRNIDAMAEDN